MTTVKYTLSGRPDNSSIRLSFSAGRRKTFKLATGFYSNKDDWSFSKKTILKNSKEKTVEVDNGHFKNSIDAKKKRIKNKLIPLEQFILTAFNELQSEEKEITGQWLKDQIDMCFERIAPSGQSVLITHAIDALLTDADVRKNQKGDNGLSKSRINHYTALKRIWKEFEAYGKNTYKVKEVNIPLSKKFLSFMLQKKQYTLSYAKRMMGTLKTVCYDAQLAEVKTSPQPKKIDATQVKNEYIIYLDPDESNQIRNAHLMGNGQRNARKWLLLGCWIGQRTFKPQPKK